MENIAIHAVNSPLHTALNLERNSVVCVNQAFGLMHVNALLMQYY